MTPRLLAHGEFRGEKHPPHPGPLPPEGRRGDPTATARFSLSSPEARRGR